MNLTAAPHNEISLFDGLCSLRWLGTNCLLIKTQNASLMIDPHFSRPGLLALLRKISPDRTAIQSELHRLQLSRLDAILVTHTHYDHFLDAVEIAGICAADIYGSESAFQAAAGVVIPEKKVIRVEPGIHYSIGDITASFYISSHLGFPGKLADWSGLNGKIEKSMKAPAWFWQYRAGTVHTILLELQGHRLFIQGSAGIDKPDEVIPPADTAILSIAALGIKNRKYRRTWFERYVLQTGAKEVWFSHWDNFFVPWNSSPHNLPGTRHALRHFTKLFSAHPNIKFNRLFPG